MIISIIKNFKKEKEQEENKILNFNKEKTLSENKSTKVKKGNYQNFSQEFTFIENLRENEKTEFFFKNLEEKIIILPIIKRIKLFMLKKIKNKYENFPNCSKKLIFVCNDCLNDFGKINIKKKKMKKQKNSI